MTDPDRQKKLDQFRAEVEGLENVVGVAYDANRKRIVALVTAKKAEDELPRDQLVANNTSLSDDEHGVVEVGDIKAHALEINTSARLRPVPAGAEEQPGDFRWVGTGSFIGRVVDPSKGTWTNGVSVGTVVRLSNWHVYVGNAFEPHRPVHQPFGGERVGEVIGAVPLEDGVKVDVAARSVSPQDGWGTVGLDTADNGEAYGRSVLADVTDEHVGQTVTKSGRTTDVTTAQIRLVDVSIRVDYGSPGNPNRIRIDDCVITSDLGDRGDSGSPVYLTGDGALCGLYFAGSDTSGVFVQISNITEALGVEPIVDWDEEVPPVEHGRSSDLQRLKDDVIAYVESWQP
jgi:hypothetical protein